MGLAAAHHTDVADVGAERALHCGYVELRVVRQDADRVALAQRAPRFVEHRARPRHDDLVGHREPAAGGEHLAGVAHGDPVAEHLGHLGERGGEVDGSEDPHLRRRRPALDEHPHGRRVDEVLRRGLALGAVVADAAAPGLELGERVAGDDAVSSGWPRSPIGSARGGDDQLGADVRAVDDRGERDRLVAR